MSKVRISGFSPVLKSYLPRKPSQGLRQEPFRALLAKSRITLACLAPRTPGTLTSTGEEELWLVLCH